METHGQDVEVFLGADVCVRAALVMGKIPDTAATSGTADEALSFNSKGT